ncbi:MAG: hypothetical protein J3Q66DRAFT_373835 [Benniella sp.]|nr:MAG: hypothetical protein J3Q66DRAFT_373835 [Benniella sp.]
MLQHDSGMCITDAMGSSLPAQRSSDTAEASSLVDTYFRFEGMLSMVGRAIVISPTSRQLAKRWLKKRGDRLAECTCWGCLYNNHPSALPCSHARPNSHGSQTASSPMRANTLSAPSFNTESPLAKGSWIRKGKVQCNPLSTWIPSYLKIWRLSTFSTNVEYHRGKVATVSNGYTSHVTKAEIPNNPPKNQAATKAPDREDSSKTSTSGQAGIKLFFHEINYRQPVYACGVTLSMGVTLEIKEAEGGGIKERVLRGVSLTMSIVVVDQFVKRRTAKSVTWCWCQFTRCKRSRDQQINTRSKGPTHVAGDQHTLQEINTRFKGSTHVARNSVVARPPKVSRIFRIDKGSNTNMRHDLRIARLRRPMLIFVVGQQRSGIGTVEKLVVHAIAWMIVVWHEALRTALTSS